jgi:23S rRNA (cytosine1962-C5)-methyltransferase
LGHNVTHVDSSQGVNDWLKDNCKLNNVNTNDLKIITDDVTAFTKRLIKRGETFDVIVLDPPAFGHGTKKELWKIEEDLPRLINDLGLLLSQNPVCVILSGYAAGYSAETYKNLLLPLVNAFGGSIEADTMTIEESGTKRMLSIGIAARWSNNAKQK